MKLHQDQAGALNTVTAYDTGYVEINAQRHSGSVFFMPEGPVNPWPIASASALTADDFTALLPAAPEIILIGTGARQVFPRPAVLTPLMQAGTGYEIMSTAAACRTYNILMAEGRQVMAALVAIGQE